MTEDIRFTVGDRVLLATAPNDIGVVVDVGWEHGHCQMCDDLSDLAGDYIPHTGPYCIVDFPIMGEGSYGHHELTHTGGAS